MVFHEDTFYLSFVENAGTEVPTLGLVPDEDIVRYDAGVWSLYLDGSAAWAEVGRFESPTARANDLFGFGVQASGAPVIAVACQVSVAGS